MIGKYKYMGQYNPQGKELIFDNDANTFRTRKDTAENKND